MRPCIQGDESAGIVDGMSKRPLALPINASKRHIDKQFGLMHQAIFR